MGDEIGLDQALARRRHLERLPAQHSSDAGVGVKAQTLSFGDSDQKQIQGEGLGVTGGRAGTPKEPLINPTSPTFDTGAVLRKVFGRFSESPREFPRKVWGARFGNALFGL